VGAHACVCAYVCATGVHMCMLVRQGRNSTNSAFNCGSDTEVAALNISLSTQKWEVRSAERASWASYCLVCPRWQHAQGGARCLFAVALCSQPSTHAGGPLAPVRLTQEWPGTACAAACADAAPLHLFASHRHGQGPHVLQHVLMRDSMC